MEKMDSSVLNNSYSEQAEKMDSSGCTQNRRRRWDRWNKWNRSFALGTCKTL